MKKLLAAFSIFAALVVWKAFGDTPPPNSILGLKAGACVGYVKGFNNVLSCDTIIGVTAGGTGLSGSVTPTEFGYLAGATANIQAQLNSGSGNLNGVSARVVVLEGQVASLQGATTSLQNQVTANATAIGILQGATAAIQSEVDALQVDVASLQGATTSLQNQVNVHSSQISALQGATTSLQIQVTANSTAIGILQGATANLQSQLDAATAQIATKVDRAGDTMTGTLMVGVTGSAIKAANPPAASGLNVLAANIVARSDSSVAGYMAVSPASNPIFEGVGYGNATTRFRGYRASGNDPSAPTAITGTGGITQLEAFGYDGVSFESGAGVFLRSTGAWSTSDHRTNIQLLNTLQGTTNLVTSLLVGDTGSVEFGPSGATVTHVANGNLQLTGVSAGYALISNGSKVIAPSPVTSTELGYLSGASANIQAQINTLAGATVAPGTYVRISGDTMTGALRITSTLSGVTHANNALAVDGGISALGDLSAGQTGDGTGGKVRLRCDTPGAPECWRIGLAGATGATNMIVRYVPSSLTVLDIDSSGNITQVNGTSPWVRKAGDTMTGSLSVGLNDFKSLTSTLDGVTGSTRALRWTTGGSLRWIMKATETAETGSEAGSDFALLARNDAGGAIDTVLQITRAAGGNISFYRPVQLGGLTPSTVPVLNGSTVLVSSAITSTELGYLSGLTGNVQAQLNGVSVDVSALVAKAGSTMTGGLGTPQVRLPFASSPGSILYGDDTDTGPFQTGDGEYYIAANGFNRVHVSQNYTEILGPVTVTGEIRVGDRIVNVPTPINPTDAANKAYVDGISVNVSGSPNTLAGFNGSGVLYSAPNWSLSDDGKIYWDKTFASGDTLNDGVDIGLYGVFQSGSTNNNRTFIRVQPSYETGATVSSLTGFHFVPQINTNFSSYYVIDQAVTLDASANGSNGGLFNVHDTINAGAQVYNGYTAGAVDITVSSAAYVNGYTAFSDTSDFLAGASVSGLNGFNSSVLVGATVNGGHLGFNFSPTYQSTAKIVNGISAFFAGPNIAGDTEQFSGVQISPTYQSTATPNGHIGYWHAPQINAPFSNNGGYVVFDDGANFNSGSFIENPNGVNLHAVWQSGSTMSGNFNYVSVTPVWSSGATLAGTSSATMVNIAPSAPAGLFNDFKGLNVSVEGITLASGGPATGITNGGLFSSNYNSRLPSIGYVQFNYLGGQMTVPSGSPVSNTLVFGLNAASSLNAYDNIGDDGSGLQLGTILGVGFVGALNVQAGVTVNTITMALAGAGAQPTGDGRIENFNGVYSAGVLPQGGMPSVGNMKAFRASNVICLLADNCRGLSIEDPLAENFLASTITLDGLTANRVPYLDATKTIQASAVTDTELGYLSGVTAAIQTQLNAKQASLTIGDLTGSGAISVTGGTGAVIGSGASITVATAGLSTTGVLTSTDFTTFNAVTGKVAKAGDTMTGALLIGATTNALLVSNPPAATGTNLIAANVVARSDSTSAGFAAVSPASNPIFEGVGYGNATTRFRGYRATGSDPSAPAAITGSGGITQLEAFGHDGTSFESGAGVFLRSTGTWSTSDHRTNIQLNNVLQGTTTLVTSLQVGDTGSITVGPSGATVTHSVNGAMAATGSLSSSATGNSVTNASNAIYSAGGISAAQDIFVGQSGAGTGGKIRIRCDSGSECWRLGPGGGTGDTDFNVRGIALNAVVLSVSTAGQTTFNYPAKMKSGLTAIGGTMYTQIAGVTVANSTSETTLMGASVGTRTIPANTLAAGDTIVGTFGGLMGCTSTPNLVMRFKANSTNHVAQTVTPATIDMGGDTENYCDNSLKIFNAQVVCTVRATGASGTLFCAGGSIDLFANNKGGGKVNFGASSSSTIDTTTSQVLDLTGQWDAADVNNQVQIHTATFEIK